MSIKIYGVISCNLIVIVMYQEQNKLLSALYHIKILDEYMAKLGYRFSYTILVVLEIPILFTIIMTLTLSNIMLQYLYQFNFWTALPDTVLIYGTYIQRQILAVLFVVILNLNLLHLNKVNRMMQLWNPKLMSRDELVYNLNFVARVYSKLINLTDYVNSSFSWVLIINIVGSTITILIWVLYLTGDALIKTEEMALWMFGNVPFTWVLLIYCNNVSYQVHA